MTNVNTIADELKAAQDELDAAKAAVDRIPALTERVDDLESALIETAKGAAPSIEATAPEPSTAPAPPPKLDGFDDDTVSAEKFHPADAAVEEIKALDDEPTGDMTTPPAPNGGMPGWSV